MIGYKWPVECKRPRSARRIFDNLDNAIEKINEREQEGIVCIGLENALQMPDSFLEVANENVAVEAVSEHLNPWLQQNSSTIRKKLEASWVRHLILTFTALCYYHDTGNIGLPSLRIAFANDGRWIGAPVIKSCIDDLTVRRIDEQTRSNSPLKLAGEAPAT